MVQTRFMVETAMDACIERGILSDILIREKAEVLHMLLTEYDEKKHLRNNWRRIPISLSRSLQVLLPGNGTFLF